MHFNPKKEEKKKENPQVSILVLMDHALQQPDFEFTLYNYYIRKKC